MNFTSKESNANDNGFFKRNPNPTNLSDKQLAEIYIGTVSGLLAGYYCDSLETGSTLDEIQTRLKQRYGTFDHDSAINTMLWLLNRGDSFYFETMKGIISDTKDEYRVQDLYVEDLPYLQKYEANLHETFDELSNFEYVGLNQEKDFATKNITAWDMNRLVFIARCSFECGYISEIECWDFIDAAYNICTSLYESWVEFGAGCAIGCAMWAGKTQTTTAVCLLIHALLCDVTSPWNQLPFNISRKYGA